MSTPACPCRGTHPRIYVKTGLLTRILECPGEGSGAGSALPQRMYARQASTNWLLGGQACQSGYPGRESARDTDGLYNGVRQGQPNVRRWLIEPIKIRPVRRSLRSCKAIRPAEQPFSENRVRVEEAISSARGIDRAPVRTSAIEEVCRMGPFVAFNLPVGVNPRPLPTDDVGFAVIECSRRKLVQVVDCGCYVV